MPFLPISANFSGGPHKMKIRQEREELQKRNRVARVSDGVEMSFLFSHCTLSSHSVYEAPSVKENVLPVPESECSPLTALKSVRYYHRPRKEEKTHAAEPTDKRANAQSRLRFKARRRQQIPVQ